MLIINHRINTIEQLKSTPQICGIEIDIRSFGEELILHHDPLKRGYLFEEFLDHYNHAFIILNIKCEGIEEKVIELVEKHGIEEYFLLDVSPPFIVKLINLGVSKIAVRYSEFESIETCLNFRGKLDWVFIDNFTHLPINDNAFDRLREYYKLCVVSPDLLMRDEIEQTKVILEKYPVDAVLTDEVDKWLSTDIF